MFYQLIRNKRDEWYGSAECTVREIVNYIEKRGMMRDTQVEAIKTYLFLKIACGNKPLWQLFSDGRFNSLNLDSISLTRISGEVVYSNPAAAALLEYSLLKTRNGSPLAPKLTDFIRNHADEIDYGQAFRDIFYGVEYPDYLFSLPMGAGKTFLMAAFIYLDLYFADNEPDNPGFAHNFIVLVPSGLKSSIVPSLKHIQDFDPSWIMPEQTAAKLKGMMQFEILDEQKSSKKSNIVRNPNAQKINSKLSTPDLMGLVAVTNAEKVILDKIDTSTDSTIQTSEDWEDIKTANEFRALIGKIPHLGIFIDEVHHAADGEIKLRQVVNDWSRTQNFCGMLGFSGTPYLEKSESVTLAGQFTIKNTDLSNVVYHYPLIDGIGNFLKDPTVSWSDSDTDTIIRNSLNEFIQKYRDTIYQDGTCAKLAIYCGTIETLEEEIFPTVSEIMAANGLNPSDTVLKFHRGNKKYPQPENSETDFASLDSPTSRFRVILLVQIGKEGWDCRSLSGVVLPQKGACPQNMVLQTSCRCLRQCDRHSPETAVIWLNSHNADTLNKQLKQQHDISLNEFNKKRPSKDVLIKRYDRTQLLHVPPIDFYQLKVSYSTLIIDEQNDIRTRLQSPELLVKSSVSLIHLQDMEGKDTGIIQMEKDESEITTFNQWLHLISKESFGTLKMTELTEYREVLKRIFMTVTTEDDGIVRYSPEFDQPRIRSLIRQCFVPQRDFTVNEEIIPQEANLLKIGCPTPEITVTDPEKYYPDQESVSHIHHWDENPHQELTPEVIAAYELLKSQGLKVPEASDIKDPHPERLHTYHYIPYRFDSSFEMEYFSRSFLPLIHDRNLEIYFNGDDQLTEFKIRCYRHDGKHWNYIGMYVPDFLLIQRKENLIHKVIIIETKGQGYAPAFAERRKFMEEDFVRRNNEKFGYERFSFLYLEDTLTKEQREARTLSAINNFFS